MSIYNFATSPLAGASTQQGGVTEQSLKFDRASISYLSRTASSPTLGTKATWSFWIKKSDVSEDTNTSYRTVFYAGTPNVDGFRIGFARYSGNGHSLQINQDQGSSGAYMYKLTDAFYRDVAGWYHFIVSYDSTNATAADRIKVYTNGELASLRTSPNTNVTLNHIPAFQVSGKTLKIGDGFGGGYNEAIDAYLADVYFIDGQALDASSFGETVNGYWKKKEYTGSYGANGFKLNFRDDTVSEGFNAVTYKGNSPASQSISGLGFSPDLVWIKSRSQTYNHVLADTVRGQGKDLYSNTTAAESSSSTELISFDADGFSVGSGGSANDPTGSLGFVAWCWDAGSGSPVSNTDGTITSTVKANPAYGFSIGTFTKGSGTETFGHGLSSAPELLILKRRDSTGSWFSYSSVTGADKWIRLNGIDAATTDSTFWNNTAPTSSVATVSTAYNSGEQLVFYAWNSVAGYSSIGSYTGNGSASGPTVTTGFRPAFVMVKRTDSTGNWVMYDNTRATYNPINKLLYANLNSAEATWGSGGVDFNATGFQVKNSGGDMNVNGGNFIYMAVADTREAAFWKDVSGENSNNWTPNNLDYRDSVFDSPANNFATFNALNLPASAVLSEGNLKFTQTLNDRAAAGNMAISSGKWYFEVYYTAGTNPETGLAPISQSYANSGATGSTDKLLLITNSTGMRTPAWSTTDTTGLSAQTGTTILGFAVDADNGKMFISANGTYFNSGDPAVGTNPQATFDSDWLDQTGGGVVPFSGIYTGTSGEVRINFGQDSTFAGTRAAGAYTDSNNIGSFAYQPPSGYLALCTANLPTPAITDGSTDFNTVTYTGTGASNSITVGFQPDFTWIKQRSGAAFHNLFDSLRVVGGDHKRLYSNSTIAEESSTYSGTTNLTSLDSDGFSLGTGTDTNNNGSTYAAWNWKAGGTAVSNTDGSITSQVSANVDAGFSIVTYTGTRTSDAGETGTPTTIGHGLGKKPAVVITKARETTTNARWNVWHQGYQPDQTYLNYQIWLNQTDGSNNAGWQRTDTGFSTTTFCPARYSWDDVSGIDYVAYCFAEIEGYSKFGSYTGNSSADGSFVYTGFRPAWILIKSTSAGTDWMIYDNKRLGYNVDNNPQRNVAAVEQTDNDIDLLSNGFKFRRSSPNFNGATHIYLAFAEVPFKVANAR